MSWVASVSVPVLSLLFSDSWSAVILSDTVEPAGMTTRPWSSFTSVATVALITSPTLFFRVLIESFIVAVMCVPAAATSGVRAGAGAGAGAAAVAGAAGFGFGLG